MRWQRRCCRWRPGLDHDDIQTVDLLRDKGGRVVSIVESPVDVFFHM